MARAKPVDPENIEIGGVIAGRYRVLERLGFGSTAVVFKVHDLLANGVVALKVLRAAVGDDSALIARFQRELAMARRLTHPNVVSLYDIGMSDGLCYISMEFVEGYSLAKRLAQRGPLPLPEFLTVAEGFCAALAWIHSQKVIHRDIKPSNVMFTTAGALKLMDFGIAKELATDQLRSTRTGTPGYASPEQQEGTPLGPASDIYSAGIMFFELLTGNRTSGRPAESFYPQPIRDAAPQLPTIIARCLERSPASRYQTAEELRAAITGIQGVFSPTSYGRIPIQDKMTAAPADATEVIPLCLKTVDCLRQVHAAGRYHAELSPQNIWLTASGTVEIDCCDSPRALGTLGLSMAKYLAPEVFSDASESGPHTCTSRDIYVLGFVFYEMLAGQQAMQRQIGHSAEDDRFWLEWHGDFRKSLQPLTEVVPRCPKALATLIHKMAAKDQAARPSSLDEIAAVLLKLHLSTEDTQPVLPVLPPPPEPAAAPQAPPPQPKARRATPPPATIQPAPPYAPEPQPAPPYIPDPQPVPPQYAAPTPAPPPAVAVRPPSPWLGHLLRAFAILIAVAALAGAGVYVVRTHNRAPHSFRLQANSLIVLDEKGEELWRRTFAEAFDSAPHPDDGLAASAPTVWFGDLAGDGRIQTLFLFRPANPEHLSALVCLSDRGEELWRFVPGRTVKTRQRAFPPPYRIASFLVAPLGPRQLPAVLVAGTHFTGYPTQVAMLSAKGELTGEYWHSGHLTHMITADLNRDGVPEIYLAGVSAARNAATLVVLTAAAFDGGALEKKPDYQIEALPDAHERARVFFPRSCLNKKLESSNRVAALKVNSNSIDVTTMELLSAPQPSLTFRLGPDMALLDLMPSETFRQAHAQMEKTGEIDHHFDQNEESTLRAIEAVRP